MDLFGTLENMPKREVDGLKIGLQQRHIGG